MEYDNIYISLSTICHVVDRLAFDFMLNPRLENKPAFSTSFPKAAYFNVRSFFAL